MIEKQILYEKFDSVSDLYARVDELKAEGWTVAGKSEILTVEDSNGGEVHNATFDVWRYI